jgi:ribosomal protein L25, Ctc-form
VERVVLHAERREGTGKSAVRKLRTQGLVPAIVYAKHESPVQVMTNRRELVKLLHQQGDKVLIDLNVKSGDATDNKTVIIKEIQYDTIREDILHVDFQQIKLTEKIRVHVPLQTKGDAEAPGVKEGGILEHILRELDIECLPADLPREILVDVSGLQISESIHVKDLHAPEGVTILTDPEQIAVLIKFAAEEKPAEVKPEGEVAVEPEVIKKKKEEEAEGGAKEEK